MKHLLKKIYFIFFLFIISLLFACKSSDKVILIEEKDPIVKTLNEKDSLIIYRKDSIINVSN